MQNEIAALSGIFLLTPLREGRPFAPVAPSCPSAFLLTPLREGRQIAANCLFITSAFLLTPLREGRRKHVRERGRDMAISTHAPAGGATSLAQIQTTLILAFLLTPLREGRPGW